MRLVDYLDRGASYGGDRPCLSVGDDIWSYRHVQLLTYRLARALARDGLSQGVSVAVLSPNDPLAFACVLSISRASAVWCPINPRAAAAENRDVLNAFDCRCLIFHSSFQDLVADIRDQLPKLDVLVCLDRSLDFAPSLHEWTTGLSQDPFEIDGNEADNGSQDLALIAGTGGTTGRPKGVMLTNQNLETMTALTLIGFPFQGTPCYLALAPMTHAAGVLCFPILALGGRVVIMPKPDFGEFLAAIERHRVTHTFLPPTAIYVLLDHPALSTTDLSSLQCFWYGAAPISPSRLEEAFEKIGPVMGQFFGQTEAPMTITTMRPEDYFDDAGTLDPQRLASAGRATPLVRVAIMDEQGRQLSVGERGEIVVRGSLVMRGYYRDDEATRAASRFGWHHTGDIGYFDDEGYLYVVDRTKDMIISGGFNVYSIEVEQALMQHTAVQDCAVVGLPHEKWGEQVTAVVQLYPGRNASAEALIAFAKSRIGSVKAPKQLELWQDLPRSKVGKVLKSEIRQRLMS